MMGRDEFEPSGLVDAAVPVEDVIISATVADDAFPSIRCAICGVPAAEARKLPVGYSNPVCRECDALAVNSSGDEPWQGYPPGSEPNRSGDGRDVIHFAPDRGENPVFIAGVKCWRRYRFGGHITRRDSYDCESLEEFQNLHRVKGGWIHTFNVAQPDGVDLDAKFCDDLIHRRRELQWIHTLAAQQRATTVTSESARELQSVVADAAVQIAELLPDLDDVSFEEYVNSVYFETESLIVMRERFNEDFRWVDVAALCDRYRSTGQESTVE